jgi:uncharacterized alkaline shock family protein YloU
VTQAQPVSSDLKPVDVSATAKSPVPSDDPPLGRRQEGRIEVASRVVEKIAARAALEVDDAGGAGARVLGRSLPGAGLAGIRGAGLDQLPTARAQVDGQLAFVDLELSVRWPAPALKVAERVRHHVIDRLETLVGLQVREVNIEITELAGRPSPDRVS